MCVKYISSFKFVTNGTFLIFLLYGTFQNNLLIQIHDGVCKGLQYFTKLSKLRCSACLVSKGLLTLLLLLLKYITNDDDEFQQYKKLSLQTLVDIHVPTGTSNYFRLTFTFYVNLNSDVRFELVQTNLLGVFISVIFHIFHVDTGTLPPYHPPTLAPSHPSSPHIQGPDPGQNIYLLHIYLTNRHTTVSSISNEYIPSVLVRSCSRLTRAHFLALVQHVKVLFESFDGSRYQKQFIKVSLYFVIPIWSPLTKTHEDTSNGQCTANLNILNNQDWQTDSAFVYLGEQSQWMCSPDTSIVQTNYP